MRSADPELQTSFCALYLRQQKSVELQKTGKVMTKLLQL